LAVLLSLALTATACGGDGDDNAGGDTKPDAGGSEGKKGGTFRLGLTEPVAIDPYNAQESEGTLVTRELFDGLTEATPDGEVVDVLAESRETNEDCTEWTFKIKDGTTFSNGDPVDAEAFIRGWNRAAVQAAASDVAYHLGGIAGFEEVNGGSATEMSGLTAEDATTLKVALAAADCEFDGKTTHTVFSPVPEVAGAADNTEFNDMPIGNGPFKMTEPWQHNTSITLERNDDFHGEAPNLDGVEISLLNPDNAQDLEYQGFQSGQFDWARMPPPQQPAAKAQYEPMGQWIEKNTNGMNYLLPMTDSPPFDSVEAREAVSWALDRDAIIEGIFKGMQTKSTTIVPPAFEDFYQEGLCESCEAQDVEKAKELAATAGLAPGTKIQLAYNTGAGHDEWIQAVAAQLKDVLGLEAQLVGQPFPELLAAQQAPGSTGLFRFAWSADYPTPENYLYPLLHTDAINKDAAGKVTGDNRARYSNPEFDELVTKARTSTDEAERISLNQEAEQIAIKDMAMIPLWNRTQYRLVSDKFENVEMDFNENPNVSTLSQK
jgi:ABC-type oligopeptide transport system substrate-binding subunit